MLPISDTADVERFDLIVFTPFPSVETSGGKENWRVKRVWGLPGENVAIKDGEFWVDDQLYQKTLEQLLSVAIPLSAIPAREPVEEDVPPSIYTDRTSVGWQLFSNDSSDGDDGVTDLEHWRTSGVRLAAGSRLTWRSLFPSKGRPMEMPQAEWLAEQEIRDDYVGNQGLSYQMHPVSDYLIQLETESNIEEDLVLRAVVQNKLVEIELMPQDQVGDGSSADAGQPTSTLRIAMGRQLWFAVCDGRIMLRTDLDETTIAWKALVEDCSTPRDGQPRIELLSPNSSCALREILVARDLYLRTNNRDGSGEEDYGEIPEDSFFVMGDNQPSSLDSRISLGFVGATKIKGRIPAP